MENNNERILIEAGLSEEQAIIYSSLLEKGPQKASYLASWSGVKRSLVYKVLDQLESMGLVEKKGGKGTVATFSPMHPSTLMGMLDRKEKALSLAKEELNFSLGTLSSQFNLIFGKPHVQFYEGKNAVEFITNDMPKVEKEIRQFIDITDALNVYKDETIKSRDKRIKLGINKKMLVPNTPANQEYITQTHQFTEYKSINVDEFPTAIQIYDNKVTMLTLTKDSAMGVVIEDKAISDTFKILFDSYWIKNT